LSISPSKQPSRSFPSCLRSINCKIFFKSFPTRRTSGNLSKMQANFSCSLLGTCCCWDGDLLVGLDVDGLLWSVVYSPKALVIFSWTSSIKLDSVTPWTSGSKSTRYLSARYSGYCHCSWRKSLTHCKYLSASFNSWILN
jgi:hypothetical protein